MPKHQLHRRLRIQIVAIGVLLSVAAFSALESTARTASRIDPIGISDDRWSVSGQQTIAGACSYRGISPTTDTCQSHFRRSFGSQRPAISGSPARTTPSVDGARQKLNDGPVLAGMDHLTQVTDQSDTEINPPILTSYIDPDKQSGVRAMGLDGTARVVVILDTGIDYRHPELSSSYFGGYDFVNDDDDPMDDANHGTAVAGVIAADGLNPRARGVAPNVKLIVGKILDSTGGRTNSLSKLIAAMRWAVDGPDMVYGTADDFRPDAINMSVAWEGFNRRDKSFCDSTTAHWLIDAIRYARSKGIVVVAPAGNDGEEGVARPGCLSAAITVGAIDSEGVIRINSSRGAGVDLVAPGNLYTTFRGGGYGTVGATSFAAAYVSGVIALIRQAHPEWTVSQVERALFETAHDLGRQGRDQTYGRGSVDAEAAIQYWAAATHDVAVEGLVAGDTDVSDDGRLFRTTDGTLTRGGSGKVWVIVRNKGDYSENVKVTLTDLTSGKTVGSTSLRLDPENPELRLFELATSTLALGEHGLQAEIQTVRAEVEIADNRQVATMQVYARPVFSRFGIVNAASQLPSALSPGEIVTIYGSQMGPPVGVGPNVKMGGTLSDSIGGTRVLVNDRPAPLIFVSSGQIDAVVPYALAGEKIDSVSVEYDSGTSTVGCCFARSDASPGLFTADGSGIGPVAAVNQSGTLNSRLDPASKGSIVALFATGIGQTDPPGADGQLILSGVYPKPVLPVKVFIDDAEAQVTYAGAAPTFVAGLAQINATIPPESRSGELTVLIDVGGLRSQAGVTITVR